jgi:elongation factor 1 alpha-like protein
MRDFFHDCPWLNVPLERQALIIEEPQLPPGRLLGGSSKGGKMSKLAALAAKRRKEAEASSASDSNVDSSEYVERLRQLRVSPSKPSAGESANGAATKGDDGLGPAAEPQPSDTAEPLQAVEEAIEAASVQHLRTPPSSFAGIVVDHGDRPSKPLLAVPDLSTPNTFDFTQPSPDDVFTRAQSRKK